MYEELFSRDGLSLERLHALVQLAEEGSLARAANGNVGLQSRLSHRLRELSEYFGVPLTERAGRSLRLTGAGERLVKLAREHFQGLIQFKNTSHGGAIRFRVGSADSLLQWLVVPAVARLRRPDVSLRFTLQDLRPEEIIGRLQDQRLEFGMVTGGVSLQGLKSKLICQVSHIVVVPYRISRRRGAESLSEALFEYPHAALVGTSTMRRGIDRMATKLGKRFEPQLECATESQCAAAVMTGQFAAVLPRWAWDSTSAMMEHFVNDDVALEELDQKLFLAWHPRLMTTLGTGAEETKRNLLAALTELSASAVKPQ